jgi:putative sterol carrier protein
VAKFLSQEWLDLQQEVGASFPERPGASARVQYKITGTPDGDVTFCTVIDNGRIVHSSLGEDASADLTMTVVYKDFLNVAKGEVEAAAAFMQGRLKMVGSSGTLMSLMPLLESSEYKAAVEKVSAATEY